jgi:hypothetical protein
MTSFRYDKENLFKEFKIAKDKDLQNKKVTYVNRLKFLKEHRDLQKQKPAIYEFVDIKWDNLILAYESPKPRDYFYTKVFGMTYAEKKAQEEAEYFEINDSDKKVDMSKNIEDTEVLH